MVSECLAFKGRRRREWRKTHNSSTNAENHDIQSRQEHLPPTLPIAPLIQEQPERAAQAVREPAGKQRADQTQQIVEDGDGLGDDPGHRPEHGDDADPDAEAAPAGLGHAIRAPVLAHVDIFGGHVTVDDPRNDDGRDRDPVGHFADRRGGGAQRGGCDIRARVPVDDDRGDDVHGRVAALEEEEGAGVLGWGVELRDEGEEGDVAGVGEDDVGDGEEGRGEAALHGGVDVVVWFGDADADHGDEHGADDGDEGDDGEVGDLVEGPREGAGDGDDEADDGENDGAGAVRGDRVHHDGEGQDVRAHDEDEEEHLGGAEDLAAPGSQHHHACVGHVVDVWICHLELPDHVAGVGCEDAETSDEDDAGDETNGGEDTGETEDAKGDGFCNLENHVSIFCTVGKRVVNTMIMPACHQCIVLYLTSELLSSPKGSFLSEPVVFTAAAFSVSLRLFLSSEPAGPV